MGQFPASILKDCHSEPNRVFRFATPGGDPRETWTADEVQIGANLFRKRIDFGLLPNDDEKTVAHGIADLDVAEGAITIIEGTVSDGTDVTPIELTPNVTAIELDATNIGITTDDDLSSLTAVIFLTYQKDAS